MKTAANLPPSDEPLAAATSAALVSNAEETASNVNAYPKPLHLNQTNPTHVKVIIHPAAAIAASRSVPAHGDRHKKARVSLGCRIQSVGARILK